MCIKSSLFSDQGKCINQQQISNYFIQSKRFIQYAKEPGIGDTFSLNQTVF